MTQKWQLSLAVWGRGRLRQENCLREDCWDQGRVKMPVRGLGEEEIRGTKRNPEKCLAEHEYRCGEDRSHSSALGRGLRTRWAEPMRLALGGRPRGWLGYSWLNRARLGLCSGVVQGLGRAGLWLRSVRGTGRVSSWVSHGKVCTFERPP